MHHISNILEMYLNKLLMIQINCSLLIIYFKLRIILFICTFYLQATIKQGDILLNRIQKLNRVINI